MSENHKDDDKTQSDIVLNEGTAVAHYSIIEKIGAGGMGEVYLAEDTKLKRRVALKFLPANLCQDEDCRARFKREAQATAALKHSNIVTIHEVSDYQGRPFFAMEHVEGKSLPEKIKEKKLTIDDAINLTMQICAGLNEAHEAGIVHRDLKPANILLDKNNQPIILDFGLATIKGTEKLTKTGSTLGTVGYLSPEQARGEKVDKRSDLFSVGVILYEMITGKQPFYHEYEAAIMNGILHDTPEPLKRYKSDVPDTLQIVIDKALDKNKETRYQTAAGMLADLKRLKKELEPSGITQINIPKKRYSRILVPSIVVVVALLLLIIKPWKFEISPRQEAIAQENKLTIMYFDNLADPTDSLKLGQITTNLLITDLSESEYVQVVSSQRLYDILKQLGREGEKKIDQSVATEIAKKEKSSWILMGSILQVEPNIIITSQLVDVETGLAIASQRINGDENSNIFGLVDRLTIEIKNDLSLPVQAFEEEDRPISEVTTNSVEAYRYFLEGIEYSNKYYGKKAEESYRKAIQYDSSFAMAYLALLEDVTGEEKETILQKMNKYSDNVSNLEKLYIKAWNAYYKDDSPDGKGYVKYLTKIIEEYPEEKMAILSLANYYREQKDTEKAKNLFLKLLELDPYFRKAYNTLAFIYNSERNFDSSIWAINKYIEIAPNESNPYDSRGELYALNGNLEEAIVSYEKALEIDPDFIGTYEKLGNLYMFNRQYEKAESMYQRLVADSDKYQRAKGRRLLARIPLHQGKIQEALSILEFGINADRMEIGEDWVIARKLWMCSFVCSNHLKDYDKATDYAKKSITIRQKLNPKDEFVNHLMANTAYYYAGKGDYESAEKTLESIKENIEQNKSSNFGNYRLAHAFVALQKGDFDSSSAYWKPTTKMSIFAADYYAAMSYYGGGRIGDAVHRLEQTMREYDENRAAWPGLSVLAHYWLGKCYESSGWNDKAIEQYETFLDIWKNADEGLESVEDAKTRLRKLKSKS